MLLIVKPWSLLKLLILLIWSASLTLRWKSLSSLSITLLESQSIQWLFVHVCSATADLSEQLMIQDYMKFGVVSSEALIPSLNLVALFHKSK